MQGRIDQVIEQNSLSVLSGSSVDWMGLYDLVEERLLEGLPEEQADTVYFYFSDLETYLCILHRQLTARMEAFRRKTSEAEKVLFIQEGLQAILQGKGVEEVRSRNVSAWGHTQFGETWRGIHKAIQEIKKVCQ